MAHELLFISENWQHCHVHNYTETCVLGVEVFIILTHETKVVRVKFRLSIIYRWLREGNIRLIHLNREN